MCTASPRAFETHLRCVNQETRAPRDGASVLAIPVQANLCAWHIGLALYIVTHTRTHLRKHWPVCAMAHIHVRKQGHGNGNAITGTDFVGRFANLH